MTSISATINSELFGSAAKRIDIWHEGGGIGRWELKLDNSSGASQILDANYVASVLGINGVNLMQGYVDDVMPEVSDPQAVFSKDLTVKGRNYGRDLASLFVIRNFVKVRFDDVVDEALSLAESEITFTSPSTAPYVDVDFNKTFLQNGFVEAAQRIGYDFVVKNDKSFDLWALADAPDSGVLLVSKPNDARNNILLIDPETKAGVDIRNYVRVDAGGLSDHWSEGNAEDYDSSDCTVADDTSVYVAGAASIKITTEAATCRAFLEFPLYNHEVLDFSNKNSQAEIWITRESSLIDVLWYLQDDEGNEILCRNDLSILSGDWKKNTVSIGPDSVFANTVWGDPKVGEYYYLSGSSFSWKIKRLGVVVFAGGVDIGKSVWIDGLKINDVDVWAYAEDATSQSSYEKRMIPLNRSDVKSQKQLQDIAANELANRKNPVYKLKLTCTLQTDLLYSGYLVNVLAPTAYIGYEETPVEYRILSLHHAAEPGVDLCRGHDAITELELIRHDGGVGADPTRFKLASAPQAAINARYDSRLRVLEGSLSGSGNLLAGAGGGGVDWWNVPYIKVAGNSYFEGDVSFSKKAIFADPDGSKNYIEEYVVMVQDPAFPEIYNPVKYSSESCWVQKDVFAQGAFMTASPPGATGGGAVQIGDRFEHMSDPSRINLTGASDYLALTKGSTIQLGYENHDVDRVLAGLRCADINARGDILPIGEGRKIGSDENPTAPWNDIVANHAHIGNVTVSNDLFVNAINTIGEDDLPINLNEGHKLLVNGDLEVTGSIIGSGVGDVYWDDILDKPYAFPPSSHTHFDQSLNKANDTQFSTVLCTNGTGSVKCGASTVAVALSLGYDASNGYLTAHSKNLVINAVSGVINMQNDTNFAGLINIRGGSINIQTSGGTNRVQFGHDGSNAYLTSLSGLLTLTGSGGIWLYGGNVSLRGGYHFIPETYETGQLGNSSYPWYASYVREVWAKNPHTYGCEPSKSDQYWERKCSSREVAEEVLTHEVTKWRKHVKYAEPSRSTDIVCVCGKVGNAPCKEHYEEWADTYGVNLGDCVEASSFLVLELDAELTRTRAELAALREEFEAYKNKQASEVKKLVG